MATFWAAVWVFEAFEVVVAFAAEAWFDEGAVVGGECCKGEEECGEPDGDGDRPEGGIEIGAGDPVCA